MYSRASNDDFGLCEEHIQPQPHTFTLSSHNIAALVCIHMLYDVCTMENHLAMYFWRSVPVIVQLIPVSLLWKIKSTGQPQRKIVNLDNLQKYSDWGFNPHTRKWKFFYVVFEILLKASWPLKSAGTWMLLEQQLGGSHRHPADLWAKVDGELLCVGVTMQKWQGEVILWLLWHRLTPVLVKSSLISATTRDSSPLRNIMQSPRFWPRSVIQTRSN